MPGSREQGSPTLLSPLTALFSIAVLQGVCSETDLVCNTKYTCGQDGRDCKCVVQTSCGSQPRPALLTALHLDDLTSYGATSLAVQQDRAEQDCR